MQKKIKIRVKDFYKDMVGGAEYVYVSAEVYEALTETFKKEAHAKRMQDRRHIANNVYAEGDIEALMAEPSELMEDAVIKKMELETLQKAMQSLTEAQRERLHLYFFEGMTTREIADKVGVSQKVVWRSIQNALYNLKKFFA